MPAPRKRSRTRHFDSIEQEAFLNLCRTYDRLRAAEDELFAPYDLTPQQYNVLRLLRGEHPETLPTLALGSRLVSRAPDITRILDHLEQRGLIVRQRQVENRRVVRVGITAAGLELLKKLDRPVRALHTKQLGHLNATQLRSLVSLLQTARGPHEPDGSVWSPHSSDA
jgi:DNA-binding MarR family transcriptional regulator